MNPDAPSPETNPENPLPPQESIPVPESIPAETQIPVSPEPAPALEPVSAPEPQTPEPTITSSSLRQIRTYQGDVADAIHNQKESIFSIHTAEKARAEKQKAEATPEEREARKQTLKTVALFFGSLVLLAGAGVAAYLSYERYQEKTAVPVISAPVNQFLPVAGSENIDVTNTSRADLISILREERAATLPDGNIRHLILRKGGTEDAPLTTPTEFVLLLSARPPGNLVRAFDDLFMLGTIGGSQNSGNDTFLLMRLDSYENAFAGMLEWESFMKDDILPLFQNDAVIASTTDATFRDKTIKNKDTRVLTDETGKTVLIYSFYNQNQLIITGSEGALRTLITELDTQALSR